MKPASTTRSIRSRRFPRIGTVPSRASHAIRQSRFRRRGIQCGRPSRQRVARARSSLRADAELRASRNGRSAEQWRTTPPTPISALAFADELPCRVLPAFADIEQAQTQQAQVEQFGSAGKTARRRENCAGSSKGRRQHRAHSADQKDSLAKAWAEHLASPTRMVPADVAPGVSVRLRAKGPRNAREARLSGKRVAAHHAATHRV